jgi:hypothetical protein
LVAGDLSLLSDFVPALTSIAAALETNPAALAVLTSLDNDLLAGGIPTGAAGYSALNSVLDQLPTDIAAPYRSLYSAEIALVSSLLNSDTGSSAETTTAGNSPGNITITNSNASNSFGSLATSTSTGGPASSSSGLAAGSSNAAAMPTGAVRMAGVAVGALAAGLAML